MISSRRSTQAPSPSNRAAVQAALDESKASSMRGIVGICGASPQVPGLNRLYRFHFRNVVADQAFDPALQRHGRGRAARTGAVHRKIKMAVPIAFIRDVAAVLRDGGPDAGFDQLLDLVDDLGVLRLFVEIQIVGDLDSRRGAD